MRMFDKRHELVKFLVVVETGSILGAAEKIAISQPALSRIICKLEEQFKGKLFERSSTGVRLTPLGSMVADRARRILREIEIAEQEICSTLSGHAGIGLSITADQIWADTVLPTTIYKSPRDTSRCRTELAGRFLCRRHSIADFRRKRLALRQYRWRWRLVAASPARTDSGHDMGDRRPREPPASRQKDHVRRPDRLSVDRIRCGLKLRRDDQDETRTTIRVRREAAA